MSAARHARSAVADPAMPARVAATFVAGGPVAAMQQALADRLAAEGVPPRLAAPYAPDAFETFVSGVSRLAGPVVLGAASIATLWLMLG